MRVHAVGARFSELAQVIRIVLSNKKSTRFEFHKPTLPRRYCVYVELYVVISSYLPYKRLTKGQVGKKNKGVFGYMILELY